METNKIQNDLNNIIDLNIKNIESNINLINGIDKMLSDSTLPKKMREQLEKKKDKLLNNKTINK